jgi:NAD(P)-dependent dehydrogenase (short-subunit alcohol dehydrogenase family)
VIAGNERGFVEDHRDDGRWESLHLGGEPGEEAFPERFLQEKQERTVRLPDLMLVQDGFVMSPELELEALQRRADPVHVGVLAHDAKQEDENGILGIDLAEFDRTFKTNVYAMFWLCRAALPRLQEGASIINTASIQAYDPSPTLLAYAPTKGAIVNFTKALAQIAIKQGVRVNAVAPGPVWTPLIPSTMPKEQVKKFGSDTAFGRAAQPALPRSA